MVVLFCYSTQLYKGGGAGEGGGGHNPRHKCFAQIVFYQIFAKCEKILHIRYYGSLGDVVARF